MSEIGPADPRDEPNVDDFVDVSLDADEWAAILQDHKDYEARKAREAEAELSLSEFSVTWDTITPDDVDEFRRALHDAKNEPDMQKFLASRPHLLVQPLGGGHGRWVIAEKKFGDQFRSDYMIAENSSQGFEWLAVELEGPQQVMFNKDGHPNKSLVHAIQQINDWRGFIESNLQYVRNPRHENGLGLVDVHPTVRGLVIIGRRHETPASTNAARRRLATMNNIDIHSWDWLVERAQMRSDELEGRRRRRAEESD
ncbi:DUF4263 domain-containing protein [Rhodococcus erythropolis]|uniref:DUF4263 domain-containing protein n=1 Tax=Rhodococcus qingshengii JCM 15477 TaxID=1303681 RepID=A0AB38RLP9_RHOSG|nr:MULTISPECIES: Shedu anti-phage system protein SduA domain-containing protein [Rhodococcus]MCQ4128905.1 DUF4263 domain-containing protein [Rhodococcus erythropolis]QSE44366.1 DUF4263 domain-containing protein [Rhodococcus erythropolis]UPU46322.1 DUF4263 domain-containing protein [Rhodococcus qingshengii JCM 15477]